MHLRAKIRRRAILVRAAAALVDPDRPDRRRLAAQRIFRARHHRATRRVRGRVKLKLMSRLNNFAWYRLYSARADAQSSGLNLYRRGDWRCNAPSVSANPGNQTREPRDLRRVIRQVGVERIRDGLRLLLRERIGVVVAGATAEFPIEKHIGYSMPNSAGAGSDPRRPSAGMFLQRISAHRIERDARVNGDSRPARSNAPLLPQIHDPRHRAAGILGLRGTAEIDRLDAADGNLLELKGARPAYPLAAAMPELAMARRRS